MVVFPFCKINLGLHILNKRSDGFHNIETVFYPVPLTDMLEIIPDRTLEEGEVKFESAGLDIGGNPDDNLVMKAHQLIHAGHALPGLRIFLYKKIPFGAGLGGGSSDAAFALKLIRDMFLPQLSNEQLKAYASELGSDCAFFIEGEPSFAHGRGELLEPISVDLKGFFLVLIKPEQNVSTAEAYGGVKPQESAVKLKEIISGPPEDWRSNLKNDFEAHIFEKYPEIRMCKEALYGAGAVYASMSGSGSSVYGLFKEMPLIPEPLKNYVLLTTRL